MRVIYLGNNYLTVSEYSALQTPHEIIIHDGAVEDFEVTVSISDPAKGTHRKERLGTIAELRKLVADAAEVKAVVDEITQGMIAEAPALRILPAVEDTPRG